MESFPIILIILAIVLIPFFIAGRRSRSQESSAIAVPESESVHTPKPVPAPEPVEVQNRATVLFADIDRNVRVCPRCDGENDTVSVRCRICGGRL